MQSVWLTTVGHQPALEDMSCEDWRQLHDRSVLYGYAYNQPYSAGYYGVRRGYARAVRYGGRVVRIGRRR
jgi:hypothetical protein